MELRKNPKIDLDKKRGVFFNIGLLISLALVTTAFEWKFYDNGIVVFENYTDEDFEKILEIPPTVQPPPPPPVVEPVFVEVSNEEEVEDIEVVIDSEITEDDILEPIIFEPPPVEKAPEVFDIVEEQPSPIGGISAFYKYVSNSMNYPKVARRMGIEGRVFVQFVVDQDGKLTEVKTIKGIGGGCDEEAERVLRNAQAWSPGKQRGRPVKVRMVLPITFQLN